MDQIVFRGVVEKEVFYNLHNGFGVWLVRLDTGDTIVLTGEVTPRPTPPAAAQGTGRWGHHPRYGRQLNVITMTFKDSSPVSFSDLHTLLASGVLSGIGPKLAERIIAHFGHDALEILLERPLALAEISGISPEKAQKIACQVQEKSALFTLMTFLAKHDIAPHWAGRLHQRYGNKAIEVLNQDPYTLACDLRGIGFHTADRFAQKLGMTPQDPRRVRAAVLTTLHKAIHDDGHCGLPLTRLNGEAFEALQEETHNSPSLETVASTTLELARTHVLVPDVWHDQACVFDPALYTLEKTIAARLQALNNSPPWWQHPKLRLTWPCSQQDLMQSISTLAHVHALSQEQTQALHMALKHNVMLITGGPGVGKTTLMRSLLELFAPLKHVIALAAPTGRAARRLWESTRLFSNTLHSLLQVDPATGAFKYSKTNPLPHHCIIVDEMSMVDIPLLAALVNALSNDTGLIIVGDPDQLPSVGPGQTLSDLLNSKVFPTIELTHVFRQAKHSALCHIAHKIRAHTFPPRYTLKKGCDYGWIETPTPEEATQRILTLVTETLPETWGYDPLKDIQVLCPMNRGPCGTTLLNQQLQARLNPRPALSLRYGQHIWGIGDRVIQCTNDRARGLSNGDIGTITDLCPETRQLVVTFEGNRQVAYNSQQRHELQLAYALSIHKAQGSEYPVVVIPVLTTHFALLSRRLFYTAITRARKLGIFIGQTKAMAMALNRQDLPRVTKLESWLRTST